VRDNLTLLGAIDADDARLTAVLDDVGLAHWLRGLPHGLDTELHGASGLSAGEAQLLAFARAFLTDPGLVVLDEASSRLDPVTETLVTRATERLLSGRTAVVIAHRLSTLDRVHEIAVVDRGRVVEHGARAVLAADARSNYARLVAAAGTAGLLADEGRVA
jgi:ABC-type multidrug transport system fused ATPase/permease subunit